MSQIFETLMLIAFGLSWPPAIYTALKTRTAKGKNVLFDICIWFGYAFGIAAKLMAGDVTYVMIFYVFNFVSAAISVLLYYLNRRLDRATPYSTE